MTRERYLDSVPPVSAYAHWNEDAERVWYEENRYDMEHADELAADREHERQYDDSAFMEREDDEDDPQHTEELEANIDKAVEHGYDLPIPSGGPCPSCGLIMSRREQTEQGACNDCFRFGSDPGA